MVVTSMPKIRVLVVDDSVVIRRMVSDVLSGEPDIEVAGAAADGRIALQKIDQVNPDILTLDVEMPVMDGLETLRQLRKTHRHLPVIMFSTLTERGASATMDALALGASDYVTKPANVGSAAAALEKIRAELIPKIRAHVPQATPSRLDPFPMPPAQVGAASISNFSAPRRGHFAGRSGGDRHLDRRAQCVGRPGPVAATEFPSARRHRAAYAAHFYQVPCRPTLFKVADARGGSVQPAGIAAGTCLHRSRRLPHDGGA